MTRSDAEQSYDDDRWSEQRFAYIVGVVCGFIGGLVMGVTVL